MKLLETPIAAVPLFLFAASLSGATLTHTWVSATGNDATCTGTTVKPCATFAQAITLTSAAGIISVMGPGDYGPVIIGESITIDGTGGGSIGFAGVGEGIFINPSAAANIVLRNLTIDGGGTGSFGIYIASAATTNTINVMIDGCLVSGASSYSIGVGSESPMYVTVKNTTIQGGTVGIRTLQSNPSTTVFDHVSVDHVSVQGATQVGIFNRNGNMDITNSSITGTLGTLPSGAGLEADTSATMNVQNTAVTSNATGICMYSGSTAVIGTSTTIVNNTTNVSNCGGSVQGMGGAGPSPKL